MSWENIIKEKKVFRDGGAQRDVRVEYFKKSNCPKDKNGNNRNIYFIIEFLCKRMSHKHHSSIVH